VGARVGLNGKLQPDNKMITIQGNVRINFFRGCIFDPTKRRDLWAIDLVFISDFAAKQLMDYTDIIYTIGEY
jgi:hypothetical protein